MATPAHHAKQDHQGALATVQALYSSAPVAIFAASHFTRHQNVERYRRLLKSATNEERRNYLGRLIAEEQQKQKDAGDSEYQD